MDKVNVVDIRIFNFCGKIELRISWSNDRHQAVLFNGFDPESVKEGFLLAAHFIGQEIKKGKI